VRSWPAQQQMPAFGAIITDSDIDAVFAYLRHLSAPLK
jgi:mono/diheme cytochrome c family protein